MEGTGSGSLSRLHQGYSAFVFSLGPVRAIVLEPDPITVSRGGRKVETTPCDALRLHGVLSCSTSARVGTHTHLVSCLTKAPVSSQLGQVDPQYPHL